MPLFELLVEFVGKTGGERLKIDNYRHTLYKGGLKFQKNGFSFKVKQISRVLTKTNSSNMLKYFIMSI